MKTLRAIWWAIWETIGRRDRPLPDPLDYEPSPVAFKVLNGGGRRVEIVDCEAKP